MDADHHADRRADVPVGTESVLARLQAALADAPPCPAAETLRRLVRAGADRLPMPGGGATLQRWRALAAVARHDLSLVKLYEGHTDALAILRELQPGAALPEAAVWAVWAAEPPGARVTLTLAPGGRVRLDGDKHWCSGAATSSHALLTAWWADGRGPQLVRLPLAQGGVRVSDTAWQAIGMRESASLDVRFDGALGDAVGEVGDYLSRPGFWQGGAGIAACWFGGAAAVGEVLRAAAGSAREGSAAAFRRAALARVDLALQGTAALLREAAARIDADPLGDAGETALRVRLSAETTATEVLDEVGRALGAGPYCRDARFARLAADLPVFVRQSHAERDFEALGRQLLAAPDTADDGIRGGWTL